MITRYKKDKFFTLLKAELLGTSPLTYRKWRYAITKVESLMKMGKLYGGFDDDSHINNFDLLTRNIPIICETCGEQLKSEGSFYCDNCDPVIRELRSMVSMGWLTQDGKLTPDLKKDVKRFKSWIK